MTTGTIEKYSIKKSALGMIGTWGNSIKPNEIVLSIAINVVRCTRVTGIIDIFLSSCLLTSPVDANKKPQILSGYNKKCSFHFLF